MDNDKPKYFDAFIKLFIHQEGIMWSKTKTLLTIESASLYVGYELRDFLAGPLFLLLGSIFLATIIVQFHRSRKYRDTVYNLLIETGESFFTKEKYFVPNTWGFLTGTRIFLCHIRDYYSV
jgi:hypothetical protein